MGSARTAALLALAAVCGNMGYKFYKVASGGSWARGQVQSPGPEYMAHIAGLRARTSLVDASIKKHRFLVIGGTGFTGSAIVHDLIARGAGAVRVMGRSLPPRVQHPYEDKLYPVPGVEYSQGDVTDVGQLKEAMDGVSVVIHTAAHYGSPTFGSRGAGRATEEVNYGGMRNIVAAAKAQGVKQLVYTSTSDVTFTPRGCRNGTEYTEDCPYADGAGAPAIGDHYARTKILAEKHCLASDDAAGLRTISLRPNGIYGPGEDSAGPKGVAPAYIMGVMPIIFDEEQRSDWVCVYNLVYAHMLAVHRLETAADQVAGRAFYITDQALLNNAAYGAFKKQIHMVGAGIWYWIVLPGRGFLKAAGYMEDAHGWLWDNVGFDLFGVFGSVMFTEKEAYKALVTHTHNTDNARQRLQYQALLDYETCATFQGEELQRRWGLKEPVGQW